MATPKKDENETETDDDIPIGAILGLVPIAAVSPGKLPIGIDIGTKKKKKKSRPRHKHKHKEKVEPVEEDEFKDLIINDEDEIVYEEGKEDVDEYAVHAALLKEQQEKGLNVAVIKKKKKDRHLDPTALIRTDHIDDDDDDDTIAAVLVPSRDTINEDMISIWGNVTRVEHVTAADEKNREARLLLRRRLFSRRGESQAFRNQLSKLMYIDMITEVQDAKVPFLQKLNGEEREQEEEKFEAMFWFHTSDTNETLYEGRFLNLQDRRKRAALILPGELTDMDANALMRIRNYVQEQTNKHYKKVHKQRMSQESRIRSRYRIRDTEAAADDDDDHDGDEEEKKTTTRVPYDPIQFNHAHVLYIPTNHGSLMYDDERCEIPLCREYTPHAIDERCAVYVVRAGKRDRLEFTIREYYDDEEDVEITSEEMKVSVDLCSDLLLLPDLPWLAGMTYITAYDIEDEYMAERQAKHDDLKPHTQSIQEAFDRETVRLNDFAEEQERLNSLSGDDDSTVENDEYVIASEDELAPLVPHAHSPLAIIIFKYIAPVWNSSPSSHTEQDPNPKDPLIDRDGIDHRPPSPKVTSTVDTSSSSSSSVTSNEEVPIQRKRLIHRKSLRKKKEKPVVDYKEAIRAKQKKVLTRRKKKKNVNDDDDEGIGFVDSIAVPPVVSATTIPPPITTAVTTATATVVPVAIVSSVVDSIPALVIDVPPVQVIKEENKQREAKHSADTLTRTADNQLVYSSSSSSSSSSLLEDIANQVFSLPPPPLEEDYGGIKKDPSTMAKWTESSNEWDSSYPTTTFPTSTRKQPFSFAPPPWEVTPRRRNKQPLKREPSIVVDLTSDEIHDDDDVVILEEKAAEEVPPRLAELDKLIMDRELWIQTFQDMDVPPERYAHLQVELENYRAEQRQFLASSSSSSTSVPPTRVVKLAKSEYGKVPTKSSTHSRPHLSSSSN